jgi:oxalate decarboxylase/phosphoglucose isomerase-like protein (cupin superfamily)
MKLRLPAVADCTMLTLPRIKNRAGNITPVHNSVEIPFDVKRIFYLYDVPGGESRGAHAHKECHQILIAASGSFEILLDDGKTQQQILLNRSYQALHIPPMIWASEINFSSGSICLVLASELYNEADYVREYSIYQSLIQQS